MGNIQSINLLWAGNIQSILFSLIPYSQWAMKFLTRSWLYNLLLRFLAGQRQNKQGAESLLLLRAALPLFNGCGKEAKYKSTGVEAQCTFIVYEFPEAVACFIECKKQRAFVYIWYKLVSKHSISGFLSFQTHVSTSILNQTHGKRRCLFRYLFRFKYFSSDLRYSFACLVRNTSKKEP